MQNMASESSNNKKSILPVIGGIVILALIIGIIVLSIGRKNQAVSYEDSMESATNTGLQTSPTSAIQNATPTATLVEATPTVTDTVSIPNTANTAESTMDQDVSDIQFVCMDNYYDAIIKNYSSFDRNTTSFRESEIVDHVISSSIPVLSCMIEVEFSQPISEDVFVSLYQARDTDAWYEILLEQIEGKENSYYAIMNHPYVIDAPYWDVNYGLKIQNTESVYWEGSLSLTRPFPGLCWEGSMPDPVTLKCPDSDSLEREPHPGMPTLVPGGLH